MHFHAPGVTDEGNLISSGMPCNRSSRSGDWSGEYMGRVAVVNDWANQGSASVDMIDNATTALRALENVMIGLEQF